MIRNTRGISVQLHLSAVFLEVSYHLAYNDRGADMGAYSQIATDFRLSRFEHLDGARVRGTGPMFRQQLKSAKILRADA